MADVTIISPGPLEQVARGIRARLELVFPPGKPFSHRWMPARVDLNAWRRLTERMPLIGIGFNEFQQTRTLQSLNVVSMWTVYVATRNESGQEALMFGDALAPGQFSLMQVAAAALHGYLIPGLGTIQVHKATNAMIEEVADPNLGIGAVDFEVPVTLGIADLLKGPGVMSANLLQQQITWAFDDGAIVNDIINTGTT